MRLLKLSPVAFCIVFIPFIAFGQVSDTQIQFLPKHYTQASFDEAEKDLQSLHITDQLLLSKEGRNALEAYREWREDDEFRLRPFAIISEVGERRIFKVLNREESTQINRVYDDIEFELRRSGEYAELWVEVEELGENKVTEDVLDAMMEGLEGETPQNSVDPERGIIEISRELFGQQPNVDGSGKVKVLIADIQDGWDPEEGGSFIAGFFNPVDLAPQSSNANSNEADIIYINSMPGIYRTDFDVSPRLQLNILAHEYQHLIHARYGNLNIFQNEGQSEMSEILMGFSPRGMTFLNRPSEVSGNVSEGSRWIYRWRSNSSDVVFDYQRAQLLHSYIEERIGPDATGSITRSTSQADNAYNNVLEPFNMTVDELFKDFYVASYFNGGIPDSDRFRYSRPQFSNIRVSFPGRFYNRSTRPWAFNQTETIYYGGALYTQWFGVEDFSIEITETDGISQHLLYRRFGETDFSQMEIGPGRVNLPEDFYEEVTLVSVNNSPNGSNASPGDSRTFTYSGEWTTTDLTLVDIDYYSDDIAGYFPLPFQSTNGEIYSFATRISPDFDASIQNIHFVINNRDGAISGSGSINLLLTEAVDWPSSEAEYRPENVIASQTVSSDNLSQGMNFISVDRNQWVVEDGRHYFVLLEHSDPSADLQIELLLDSGSANTSDRNYFPVRTLVGFRDNGDFLGWGWFPENDEGNMHNNVVMGATLIGSKPGEEIEFPEMPIADDFRLIKNYPNPFNNGTVIEYNIPEESPIRITIHDVLGRQVAELVNRVSESGLHSIRFDAEGLSSGLYFYRLFTPQGVDTKKMLLVK